MISVPAVHVTGVLWVPDEDYDAADRTGLTQEAFLRWSARLGLSEVRFGKPGHRPRRTRGTLSLPRARKQVRGQTTVEDHL